MAAAPGGSPVCPGDRLPRTVTRALVGSCQPGTGYGRTTNRSLHAASLSPGRANSSWVSRLPGRPAVEGAPCGLRANAPGGTATPVATSLAWLTAYMVLFLALAVRAYRREVEQQFG